MQPIREMLGVELLEMEMQYRSGNSFDTDESFLSLDRNDVPERRRSTRVPVNDLSEILNEKGKSVCGCVVHNLSETGAMLEVSHQDLPKRFVLANRKKNTKAACSIVWQCGGLVGVEFLTEPRSYSAS